MKAFPLRGHRVKGPQLRKLYLAYVLAALIPVGLFVLVQIPVFSQSNEDQLAQRVNRGDLYVQQGKFPEAVIEYRNAARAGPTDISIHWKLSQATLKTRDFQTALTELQRVVALDPNHERAKETLGEIYLAIGKRAEWQSTGNS